MKTTFENFFEKVDDLLFCMGEVHNAIINSKVTKPPPPSTLSLEQALIYLYEHGIQVSKSKIYKLTSRKSIPYKKFGNKLVFDTKELDVWINLGLKENSSHSIDNIVKSASLKINRKKLCR